MLFSSSLACLDARWSPLWCDGRMNDEPLRILSTSRPPCFASYISMLHSVFYWYLSVISTWLFVARSGCVLFSGSMDLPFRFWSRDAKSLSQTHIPPAVDERYHHLKVPFQVHVLDTFFDDGGKSMARGDIAGLRIHGFQKRTSWASRRDKGFLQRQWSTVLDIPGDNGPCYVLSSLSCSPAQPELMAEVLPGSGHLHLHHFSLCFVVSISLALLVDLVFLSRLPSFMLPHICDSWKTANCLALVCMHGLGSMDLSYSIP